MHSCAGTHLQHLSSAASKGGILLTNAQRDVRQTSKPYLFVRRLHNRVKGRQFTAEYAGSFSFANRINPVISLTITVSAYQLCEIITKTALRLFAMSMRILMLRQMRCRNQPLPCSARRRRHIRAIPVARLGAADEAFRRSCVPARPAPARGHRLGRTERLVGRQSRQLIAAVRWRQRRLPVITEHPVDLHMQPDAQPKTGSGNAAYALPLPVTDVRCRRNSSKATFWNHRRRRSHRIPGVAPPVRSRAALQMIEQQRRSLPFPRDCNQSQETG